MKSKEYIIRSKYYPKENLGRVMLDFDSDTGVIYPLNSYKGLHPDFMLEVWADRGIKKISGYDADDWLKLRVCPPGRHNIKEILEYNGLDKYSVTGIIDCNKGYCDYDDLWFEEVVK